MREVMGVTRVSEEPLSGWGLLMKSMKHRVLITTLQLYRNALRSAWSNLFQRHIPYPEQSLDDEKRKASQHPKRRSINLQHLITLKGCSRMNTTGITHSGMTAMKGPEGPCRTGKHIPILQRTQYTNTTKPPPSPSPATPPNRLPSPISHQTSPPSSPHLLQIATTAPHYPPPDHPLPLFRSPSSPRRPCTYRTPALCQTCWRFGKVGFAPPCRHRSNHTAQRARRDETRSWTPLATFFCTNAG